MSTPRPDMSTPEGCRERLRELFPIGATITTMVHPSSSTSHAVTVLAVVDGQPYNVSWLVARALGWRVHSKIMGVRVGGVGMRKDFWVAHEMMITVHGASAIAAHHPHAFTLNDIG